MYHNSHEILTKIESQVKVVVGYDCAPSHFYKTPESDIKPLCASIHGNSLTNVALGQVGIGRTLVKIIQQISKKHIRLSCAPKLMNS